MSIGRREQERTKAMSDESQIREIMNNHAKALYAKNAEQTATHVGDDFIAYTLAPPLVHRGAEIDGAKAWFATWKGPIVWENRDVKIAASGDVAFATSLGHMTGTKVEGFEVDIWTRCTDCFRKIGGEWRHVHSHTSVPFYMDGPPMAAIDLKP
jgi:ketosteroid isomerase-like protein